MKIEDEVRQIAECRHGMAIPFGTRSVLRCPQCGAMRVGDGPWALPHLVDHLLRAWKKSREQPS